MDKIEDLNGNYITYEYFTDKGTVYLKKIKYTWNSDAPADPTYEVKFIYNPDPDLLADYDQDSGASYNWTGDPSEGDGYGRTYDLGFR